jgi:hypothetical protein
MATQTLIITKVATAPLTIKINCPVAKGYFIGHAIIRSKPEMKQLTDDIDNGVYEDNEEGLVRALYTKFEGLPEDGADGFKEILTGDASAYLPAGVAEAYFTQYGEARRGNFSKRRGR